MPFCGKIINGHTNPQEETEHDSGLRFESYDKIPRTGRHDTILQAMNFEGDFPYNHKEPESDLYIPENILLSCFQRTFQCFNPRSVAKDIEEDRT